MPPGTCNPSREVLGLDAGPGLVFVYFREFSCTAASMQNRCKHEVSKCACATCNASLLSGSNRVRK